MEQCDNVGDLLAKCPQRGLLLSALVKNKKGTLFVKLSLILNA